MHNCMSRYDVLTFSVINLISRPERNCNSALSANRHCSFKWIKNQQKKISEKDNWFSFSIPLVSKEFFEINVQKIIPCGLQENVDYRASTTLENYVWNISIPNSYRITKILIFVHKIIIVNQFHMNFNHIDFFRCAHWSKTNQTSRWQNCVSNQI